MFVSFSSERYIILYIFIIAFAARIFTMLYLKTWISPITLEYGEIANNIVAGKGFSFSFYGYREASPLLSFMPPLYPILLAASIFLLKNPYLWVQILQIIISSLTCILIYFIGKKLFGKKVGFVASSIGILHVPTIFYSTCICPLTFDIFFLGLFFLFLFYCAENPCLKNQLIAGVAFGLSILNRTTMIGFFPLVIIWLLINVENKRMAAKTGIILFISAVAIVSPWTIRNYLKHHSLVMVSTNGGFNFWVGNNPFSTGSGFLINFKDYLKYTKESGETLHIFQNDPVILEKYPLPNELIAKIRELMEVEIDSALYKAGFNFIKDHPRRYLQLVKEKLKAFWWFRKGVGTHAGYKKSWTLIYKTTYIPFFILFVIGIFFTIKQWKNLLLFYMLFGYFTAIYMNFFVRTRFRWNIELFFAIFIGYVIVLMFKLIRNRMYQN